MKLVVGTESPILKEKTCKWKHVDNGMFGFHDYCWETECNQSYDAEKVIKSNYCPNCGGKITD